jgi:alpha-ketoglutarate-dependent taurine dioxygenase
MCATSSSPSNEPPVCRRRPVSSPACSAPTHDHHSRPDPAQRTLRRPDRTPFDELLDEASHQALRDALVDHKVLVLPGADPSIEQHITLATVFGDAEPPQPQKPCHEDSDLVCVVDSAEGYKADRWHADETFADTPSSGVALVMRMKPDVGGDTLWLDT